MVLEDGFANGCEGATVHGMEMNQSYILFYDCNYLGTSVGCPVRMVMLLDVKEH